jgi:hypothetical protein
LLTETNMSSIEILQELFRQIDNTLEEEYSCEEVLALMDQFAEACITDEDASRLMPLVQHHLDLCSDCRDEIEALLRILQGLQAS